MKLCGGNMQIRMGFRREALSTLNRTPLCKQNAVHNITNGKSVPYQRCLFNTA